MIMKLKKSKGSYLKSLDDTCVEKVTEDMQKCLDGWVEQDLDTESAVLALVSFALDLAFYYSKSPQQVFRAIANLISEKVEQDNINIEDLLNDFSYLESLQKDNIVH